MEKANNRYMVKILKIYEPLVDRMKEGDLFDQLIKEYKTGKIEGQSVNSRAGQHKYSMVQRALKYFWGLQYLEPDSWDYNRYFAIWNTFHGGHGEIDTFKERLRKERHKRWIDELNENAG